MNRREFLTTAAGAALASAMPLPSLPEPAAAVGRWFAVGNGEMHYAFWAKTAEEAVKLYAQEHDAVVGESCPDCGEADCTEHNVDLDAPQPWLEAHSFKSWEAFGPAEEPPKSAWMREGYYVPCDACNDWEPTQCYEHEGRALCCDCYHAARIERLDRIIAEDHAPG
jgi:hypothetical protein